MRSRFAIGHHQHDGHGVRMLVQMLTGQDQRMVQVGALDIGTLQAYQVGQFNLLRASTEGDELQSIRPETGGDELVQRECGALHRHPTAVLHHRP